MRLRLLLLVGLVAGLSVPLAAQTEAYIKRGSLERQGRAWVEVAECGASVSEGAQLVVRADFGSVQVKPGANDRMSCRVRLAAYTGSQEEARRLVSQYRFTIRRVTGGGVYLGGKYTGGHRHSVRGSLTYEIEVPLRFALDIETQGGNVVVERLEGELRAATAGGDIRAGDINGPVRTETAGGNIELGNIGRRVEARTAGGCVRVGDVKGDAVLETSGGQILAGRIEGGVRAETAGGDIVLRGAGTDIYAQTAGGQIRIGESGGSVRALTSGGSIRLDASRGPVRVETAGGSIDLYLVKNAVQASTAAGRILAQIAASRDAFAASDLETSFGDVEVYLPADLALTIDATIDMAAGHKVQTDFPLQIEGDQVGYRVGTLRAHGAVNGGGQTLRIRTVAGNIEIRRLTPEILERLKQRQALAWERWQQQIEKQREKEGKWKQEEPPF